MAAFFYNHARDPPLPTADLPRFLSLSVPFRFAISENSSNYFWQAASIDYMNLNLFLDKSKINRHSNLITGPIWIEVDGRPFPVKGWDDFPVIILSWWIRSLSSGESKGRCTFMDGPFAFELDAQPNGMEIIFFENDAEVARNFVETSTNEFLLQLVETGQELVQHTKQIHPDLVNNSDVMQLSLLLIS